MAEAQLTFLDHLPKSEAYAEVTRAILATIEGEQNLIARMSSVACLLSQTFSAYFWTGFYLVDQDKKAMGIDELVVGPYQGSMGCLRIAFGRGVCGTAAATGVTQVVKNVHDLKNHIACDSRSKSEIVVPVFDRSGDLIAVLDVDSDRLSAFDVVDQVALETLMKAVFGEICTPYT